MDISIILPIHNEKENIAQVVSELESVLLPTKKQFEIIAIDDCSTDGTSQLLKKLGSENPYLKVIFFRANRGQSAAFDAGFRHASGAVVVTMDADGQNDPADIPKMIGALDGYDFVSGWRKDRKDGFFLRRLPSIIANKIILSLLKSPVHDLGCSLKVYRRDIAKDLVLYGEMHRFISILVEDLGARVGEVEVNHRPRLQGKSKYGLNRIVKVILDLITVSFMRKYHTKPIYVFGGMGVALIAFALATSGVVLYEKFASDIYVHRNPLFIISSVCAMIGFNFIGMGLLAEILVRTYFESQHKKAYIISSKIGFES